MTKLIKPYHPHPPHPPPANPMSNSNSGAGPVSFPSNPSDPSTANHSKYNGLSADDPTCEKSKKHLGLFTTVKRASSSAHLRLRSISTFTRSRSHGKGKMHSSESSESYSSSHSSESSEVSDSELGSEFPSNPHPHSHIFSDPPGAITKDIEPRRRRVSLPAFNRLRLLRSKSSRTSVKSSTDAIPVTDSTIGYTTDELEPVTARPGSLAFEAPTRYQSLNHTSHNLYSESPGPVAESSSPDIIMELSPPLFSPPGLDVSISSSSSTVPLMVPVPLQKPDELLDEDTLTPTLPSSRSPPSATLSQTPPSILDPIDADSDYEDSEDEDNPELDLLEGRFISSVFIRVPVWSVRNPIGFGLIWWLLPGKRLF